MDDGFGMNKNVAQFYVVLTTSSVHNILSHNNAHTHRIIHYAFHLISMTTIGGGARVVVVIVSNSVSSFIK